MAWAAFRLSLKLIYRRIGILLLGNVLWIVCSLPLVTLPAATGALFYLAHRVIRDERELEDTAHIRDFWTGFRLYWRRSTGLFLLDVAVLIVLLVGLRFYLLSPVPAFNWLAGPVILFLVSWVGIQIYLFPLLIIAPELPTWPLLKKAFFLVMSYPLQNFMLIVWLAVLIAVGTLLAGPVLFILFSFLALVQTFALRILRIERGEIPPAKAGRLKDKA